jgi:hypothetical protein
MQQPFIPKTSTKLKRGDFAFLPRSDGRFVPLVFIEHVPRHRATFYGALIQAVIDGPNLEQDGATLTIGELAMIDIRVFAAANAPVVGNLAQRLNDDDIRERLDRQRIRSVVWGMATPLKYANALSAD